AKCINIPYHQADPQKSVLNQTSCRAGIPKILNSSLRSKSQVFADIVLSSDAMDKFLACSTKDKRAFCAYVLLKDARK
ncbi:MAG: hypothetical protein POH28_04000, partial [Acidocella sp.]|nr:hypothetical protein [Acidocella sp.]